MCNIEEITTRKQAILPLNPHFLSVSHSFSPSALPGIVRTPDVHLFGRNRRKPPGGNTVKSSKTYEKEQKLTELTGRKEPTMRLILSNSPKGGTTLCATFLSFLPKNENHSAPHTSLFLPKMEVRTGHILQPFLPKMEVRAGHILPVSPKERRQNGTHSPCFSPKMGDRTGHILPVSHQRTEVKRTHSPCFSPTRVVYPGCNRCTSYPRWYTQGVQGVHPTHGGIPRVYKEVYPGI